MESWRFTYQQNQFFGECMPCTLALFWAIVRSALVNWKISTRQAIEKAVDEGLPLDRFIHDSDFQKFCLRRLEMPRAGEAFAALSIEQRLLQWANDLKMWLPCFIFAVREFLAVPKTDKDGNPLYDDHGQPKMVCRRKQPNIKELSGLFMFDGDHLPMDPREVYERTLRPGFPWKVRLSHRTSSGHGIRLVCEALAEVGNIADNQIEMARELGLLGMLGTTGKPVTDNSCVDASRISYAPRMCDIFFIDEDHLF